MSKEIDKAVKKLKETYGSLRVAGAEPDTREFISTGNKALDLALDGGIALGYAVEFSGKSGSGKTTLIQKMLADAQQKYGTIGVWLDREKAFYNDRAESLGIDLDKTIVVHPQDIAEVKDATQFVVDIMPTLPKSAYKFIAIDSIASFDDPAKTDRSEMGRKAKDVHRMFRRLLPLVDDKTILIFANHRTFKIGVFGDPETVTCGEGVKFYTSYRIKLDDKREIKDANKGNETTGNWLKAKVIKTRSGPNYRTVVFPHYYKTGIPYLGGYARLLVDRNYLKPKNKKEFNAFNQVTVKYKDNEFSEFDIEKKLKEFPELDFNEYPEWKEEEDEQKGKGKKGTKHSKNDGKQLEEQLHTVA